MLAALLLHVPVPVVGGVFEEGQHCGAGVVEEGVVDGEAEFEERGARVGGG